MLHMLLSGVTPLRWATVPQRDLSVRVLLPGRTGL
jgi:hypothetical protein